MVSGFQPQAASMEAGGGGGIESCFETSGIIILSI
jgi:hypothetical protein